MGAGVRDIVIEQGVTFQLLTAVALRAAMKRKRRELQQVKKRGARATPPRS